MNEIDVSDIAPEALLVGLYNNARPGGMGVFQARPGDMTEKEAMALLTGEEVETDYEGAFGCGRGVGKRAYFDHLYGRSMKVALNCKTLHTDLYDRDHGIGAAQRVVDKIRETYD